jgi:CheY-like chemotaxis protein
MAAASSDLVQPAELRSHVKHLADLENTLNQEFANNEQQVAAANSSLLQVEKQIAGAIDEFSSRLIQGSIEGWVDVKDKNALIREIDQLKSQQIAQTRQIGATAVEPMLDWARNLKERVEPAMAGAQALRSIVDKIRPILLVVDDEEMMQKMVARALDATKYEIVFASDANSALKQLRRLRPDAILMDVKLPGQDGVSLTKWLKCMPNLATIPVIMLTGDARR